MFRKGATHKLKPSPSNITAIGLSNSIVGPQDHLPDTTMASSIGFVCAFAASDNQSSSVYCSKVPADGAVVDSTALAGHGGGCVTCLAAAHLAASFHVLPVTAFSNCLLVNSSITSVTHSEVSPAFLLSQWRTFSSLSIPSFHLGHAVGALNHIQPSLLFGNLY